jgi:hypothetical protein
MTVGESFDKRIFWDVDPDKLDWQANTRFIIERVLTRGFANDVRLMFRTYSKEQITKAVMENRTLDKKTANFMGNYLNIPIEKIHVAPEHY